MSFARSSRSTPRKAAELALAGPFGGDDSNVAGSAEHSPAVFASGATPADRPITVEKLTQELRALLQGIYPNVYVEGEVSGCRPAASGHVYFTLKDANAAISCVMWRTDAARLRQPLRDGAKVEVRGALDVYPQRGTYQILVSAVNPAGVGRLFLQFEELKARLSEEGLFADERKRPLPRFPRLIGIVTSPAGAALRDVLKVLGRRAPGVPVLIGPARVQGQGAGEEVAAAIRMFNALPMSASDSRKPTRPDVLIVTRGGGSIEDLWAFNEEVVARAITASSIPTVSAVGHQTDTTIADFVADERAPTPSAAAEIVMPAREDLLRHLDAVRSRMEGSVRRHVAPIRGVVHLKARLESMLPPRVRALHARLRAFESCAAMQRPRQRLFELRQRLDESHNRLDRAMEARRNSTARRHETLSAQLAALDPKAVLRRGYSITVDAETGLALRSVQEAGATTPGHPLKVVLSDGSFDAVSRASAPQELRSASASPPVDTGKPPNRKVTRKRKANAGSVAEFFGIDQLTRED